MTIREPPRLGPDSPARSETRRAFLIRLAQGTAFVPPLMLTYELAAAQGPGSGGPPGKLSKTKATTTTFTLEESATSSPAVPESSTYGATAPWAKPPP